MHTDSPKKYWSLVNELRKDLNNDTSSSINPDTWFSHFEKLGSVNDRFSERIGILEKDLENLEKIKCFNELDNKISLSEISEAIAKLKCYKASGLDNISNNMLKYGQASLLESLSNIFNTCLTHSLYPETWAEGYIVTLHKGNDPCDPNNYRGITITSALGKLFNAILDKRLTKFLENNKIIDPCQIGFTKKARTSDHMFILRCILDKYCHNKDGRVFACFVDFQKAFDTVIHTGIKLKLLDIGVGSLFYKIIKCMYSNSKSSVKIGQQRTPWFDNKVGVRQGDNLSPNLFKVFINDLPRYFDNISDAIKLNDHTVNCLMYADDVILLSSSATGLQKRLDKLGKYCNDWCMNVNTNKTKILIFNRAGRHISQKFSLNDCTIECVSRYKYLGLYFSASGSFSYAQEELYQRALKGYFKLSKDFLSHNPSVKTSLHVFDHTIKPILLYGCEIWGQFNTTTARFRNGVISFDRIFSNICCEKLHVSFCKFILGTHKKTSNLAVLSELGRFPFHFVIIKTMLKYWHRLENLGTSFPLLNDAFLSSKQLFWKKLPSWYSSINQILKTLKTDNGLSSLGDYIFTKKLNQLVSSHYIDQWHNDLITCSVGKLRTYTLLKTNFGLEKYLVLLDKIVDRKKITQLRVSSHKLMIEQGRYKSIPSTERFCLKCTLGQVEDEIHFLFNCPSHLEDRKQLYKLITKSCPNFHYLNNTDKLKWLLCCENSQVLLCLSRFISSNEVKNVINNS